MIDKNQVRAQVLWFDRNKGYGFCKCSKIERDIFFHRSALTEAGLYNVNKNDVLLGTLVSEKMGHFKLCQITYWEKAPEISEIQYLESFPTAVWDFFRIKCYLIRRGYGFLHPKDSINEDVFFHFDSVRGLGSEDLRPENKVSVFYVPSDHPKVLIVTKVAEAVRKM
ncbi:cold shock domain-containing protein [Alphaproteobacteria bacterium LSUCC0684]